MVLSVIRVWVMQIEQMEDEMQAAKQEAASQVAAARIEAAAAKDTAHREAQQHGASTMASAMEREATLSNSLSDLRAEYEASCCLLPHHMPIAFWQSCLAASMQRRLPAEVEAVPASSRTDSLAITMQLAPMHKLLEAQQTGKAAARD